MQDIKLNAVEEGNVHSFVSILINAMLVLSKYSPPWNFLRDNVSVEEAKKLLAPFFMGRHLVHAPLEYLEKMVFADILKLWKEENSCDSL